MKDTLQPGLAVEHRFVVPDSKTVPALYPESPEFVAMPAVFATGFLVGLLEWTAILCVNPHLDGPDEQTVGVHIDVSHDAATPPGMAVVARAELVAVEGRRLSFLVEAADEHERIAAGRHDRFVIDRARFDQRVAAKARG